MYSFKACIHFVAFCSLLDSGAPLPHAHGTPMVECGFYYHSGD
jgi:hypothetical protein